MSRFDFSVARRANQEARTDAAVRAERERIARLLSRWNYVDGKAAAIHIRKQGRQRDARRVTVQG